MIKVASKQSYINSKTLYNHNSYNTTNVFYNLVTRTTTSTNVTVSFANVITKLNNGELVVNQPVTFKFTFKAIKTNTSSSSYSTTETARSMCMSLYIRAAGMSGIALYDYGTNNKSTSVILTSAGIGNTMSFNMYLNSNNVTYTGRVNDNYKTYTYLTNVSLATVLAKTYNFAITQYYSFNNFEITAGSNAIQYRDVFTEYPHIINTIRYTEDDSHKVSKVRAIEFI